MRRHEDSSPLGGVINLSSIVRQVELIPVFGKKIDSKMNRSNVLDVAEWYYINSFLDKEVYQAVY